MATLTIQLDAGANSRLMSKTIEAPALQRLLDAMKIRHESTSAEPLTDEQAFDAWAAAVFQQVRVDVQRVEENVAQRAASEGVVQIDFS